MSRLDNFKNSVLNVGKETIAPEKKAVELAAGAGYWAGQNSIPSMYQNEIEFNKKYPALKPLPIWQQVKNYFDPHKNPENNWQNDMIGTAWAFVVPENRGTQWIVTMLGEVVDAMMPALQKAGPKAMAKFSNILKQSKGNPEALAKITEKYKEFLPANFSIKPWEFSSVKNYMNRDINGNLTKASNFESRPVGELKGKAKIDTWLNTKPAYERGYWNKPADDLIDTEWNNRGKPNWNDPRYKRSSSTTPEQDNAYDDLQLAVKEQAQRMY